MKTFVRLLMVLIVAWHAGAAAQAASGEKPYVVLEEDLQQLKDDFNAKVGTVRLLFILGPTCGICLRGMADLNDKFLAEYQSDPRLHTFGVHVPTLKAEDKHLAPAIELMKGPRIYHYWDAVGTIGQLYQPILNTEAYVWDVWFIYGPEAVWHDKTPPTPDFWQHQLSPFPRELRLNKKTFAAEAIARVNQLDLNDFDATPMAANENPLADGAVISWVGQGFGRAIRQYREAQGGSDAIRAVYKREYQGDLVIGDETLDLFVTEERPNLIEKNVPDADYVISYDGGETVERQGHLPREGVPLDIEGQLLGYFDFDTPLIDWNKKGHKFAMEGMEKIGGVLAWNLVQTDPDARKWTYLINSHSGTMERMRAYDADGKLMVSVLYSDYRDVDDMPIAHRIDYRDANGALLAVEQFDAVRLFTDSDGDNE